MTVVLLIILLFLVCLIDIIPFLDGLYSSKLCYSVILTNYFTTFVQNADVANLLLVFI